MDFEIFEVKQLPYEPQTHELQPCDCRFAIRKRDESLKGIRNLRSDRENETKTIHPETHS